MPLNVEDIKAMQFVQENPKDPAAPQIEQKVLGKIARYSPEEYEQVGMTPEDVGAVRWVMENPGHESAPDVRRKLLLKAAPTVNDNGVSFGQRFQVKNFIPRDPALQEQFLQKEGFETRRAPDGELEVRKAGTYNFSRLDPEGFDVQDISDVALDVGEAVVDTVATPLRAALPVGMAAGATVGMGFETLRQRGAQLLGLREDLSPWDIAEAGVIGAGVPVAFRAGSKALKWLGASLFPAAKNADEVFKIGKELGVKPTEGSLSGSKLIRNTEAAQSSKTGTMGGILLRRRVAKNKEAVQEVANTIAEAKTGRDAVQVGSEFKEQLVEGLKKRLEPAEAIYEKYENIFRRKAFKPDTAPIKELMEELPKRDILEDAAENVLKRMSGKLDQVENLTQLKSFRSQLGRKIGRATDPEVKWVLGKVYDVATQVRSNTLKNLVASGKGEPEFFELALKEITDADAIYRQAAVDVQSIFKLKSKKGLQASLQDFTRKVADGDVVSKMFNFKDPKNIKLIQEVFPDAYKSLHEGAVNKVLNGVAKTKDGVIEISPQALATKLLQLKQQSGEALQLLLGPDAGKKADAMAKALSAMPDIYKLNPSGTAPTIFNISMGTLQQVPSLMRSILLKTPGALRAGAKGFELPAARAAGVFGTRQLVDSNDQGNTTFRIPGGP